MTFQQPTYFQLATIRCPDIWPCGYGYRCLIHDRDAIFSRDVDDAVKAMGIRPLKTPIRRALATSFCERLIGTIRRECLDHLIPLNERHLRRILTTWKSHYNRGRPHMAPGPGIPDESFGSAGTPANDAASDS